MNPIYRYLMDACGSGDLELVQRILDDKPRYVNCKNQYGNTPLHYACFHGKTEVAMLLVERGANIHAKGQGLCTSLHFACLKGDIQIVTTLIMGGADIFVRGQHELFQPMRLGYTPLDLACSKGHTAVAAVLIERGADVNSRSECLFSPLHLACKAGHIELAFMLIERGADIRARDELQATPDCTFMMEVHFNQLWNFSPLMTALCADDICGFNELLDSYDETTDVTSDDGWGALHAGVFWGRKEYVVLYLEKGSVPADKKSAGAGLYKLTALHIACARGDLEMLSAIVGKIM